MGRPTKAPPVQASSNVPSDVGLDPLPDPEGVPSLSAPAFFEALDPPPSDAGDGIGMAMDHVPDFFDLG